MLHGFGGVAFLMMVGKPSSPGRKLLSGSALRVGNLLAAAAASLFLMPFIVHHLGDRTYGFWSLASAFIGYYGLLDLGLSSAVSQHICVAIGRRDPAECRAVFNTALRIQLVLGGVALLATAAIAAATPWFCHNPADAHAFWRVIVLLGINAALGFPARVYGGVLEAEFRFDIQSWLAILGLALRTGLVVWAILAGGGLLALAWVTLLATLPVTALQAWFARREASWARIEGLSVEPKRAKSLFSYSAYTFVATVADAFRFQVDPLVISGFIGMAAVTHYRVASIFTTYYINIIIASLGVFQPVLSRLHGAEDQAGLEKVFLFATKVSGCISVLILAGIIGWGRPFIARWMGQKYEDAYWPLVALSLAAFMDVFQTPSIALLRATFRHRFYAYTNLAEGVINLAFSLALARPLGIVGVALGTLIGALPIRLGVQPWWVCRGTGLLYGRYTGFLGRNLLYCGCLVGTAMAIVAWGLKPSYPWLAGSAICATAIYGAGSWLLVFNRGEREQIMTVITSRGRQRAEPAIIGVPVQ
jgi:O-antigen/teichoic acid export membrane protein